MARLPAGRACHAQRHDRRARCRRIYDTGVAAHERRRGIGSALTSTALELGRAAGCRVATLNATPEGELLYRTLGFRFVGVAQTWWR